jgi:hypothetical protein
MFHNGKTRKYINNACLIVCYAEFDTLYVSSLSGTQKKGVNMEREEIIVLEESEDEPIGPLGYCCHLLYLPYMR